MTASVHALTRPLVVDLDGTLIRTDLLVESVSQFLIQHPFQCFKPLLWLLRGKAALKTELAQRVKLDASALPYNLEVLDWLRTEKQSGRHLVLATASHRDLAEQVAQHLHLFDEVLATEGDINLKSTAKAQALVARFGEDGYDYVGNDWPDLNVWAQAHTAHVVDAPAALLARAQTQGHVDHVFDSGMPASWLAMLKAMRLHQWMKNLLVFVPLMAAHQYADVSRDGFALMAFWVFSLTASSVYLLNDLVDVQDDRHHVRKRHRPFASGALSLVAGWVTWPVLLLVAVVLSALYMPVLFSVSLGVYFVLTVAYSLYLKQLAVVDVLTLAALYTLRIIAGAAAIDVAVSFWLLLFSMFIFLSLALIKRYSELKVAREAGKSGALRGRGYAPEDLELVSSLGGSAGFIAVLVLALYIQDGQAAHLYATPQLIWLACPVMLFWISRAWLIAHRGRMHDDPIVFALKDKVSWGVGVFMGAVLALARVLS
ncbi:UbiA family prenyltransferase [Limnohabitans sp.]|uniref:UbiA family prenyltransferase n=1 Tax=Limnohabitans sp. TaxID=1907725 RepID=UPI00286F7204|nr:UbiA family prenyltransferase [Limnohabitans sp.]